MDSKWGLSPAGRVLLGYGAAFVVLFLLRSLFTTPIEEGGDAIQSWGAAIWSHESGRLDSLLINQHTARWTIVLPTTGLLRLLGYAPHVYYLLPVSLFVALLLMLLRSMREHLPAPLLVATGALLFAEPMLFRASTQLKPFAFGLFFVVCSGLAAVRFVRTGRRRHLALSALLMFLAYGAKMPYAYFAAGIGAFVWWERRRLREPLLFGALFTSLVGLETLAFNALGKGTLTWGRFEVITRHHLRVGGGIGDTAGDTLGEFLRRQLAPWLDLPWFDALFALALVGLGLAALWRRGRRSTRPMPPVVTLCLWMLFSYAFLNTFLVARLDPVMTPQPPMVRYLAPLTPFLIVTVIWLLAQTLEAWSPARRRLAHGLVATASGVLLVACLAGLSPASYRHHEMVHPSRDAYLWRIDGDFERLRASLADGTAVLVGTESHRLGLSWTLEGSVRPGQLAHDRLEGTSWLLYDRELGRDALEVCRRAAVNRAGLLGEVVPCPAADPGVPHASVESAAQ